MELQGLDDDDLDELHDAICRANEILEACDAQIDDAVVAAIEREICERAKKSIL